MTFCRRLSESMDACREAGRRRYDFALMRGGYERRTLPPRALAKLLEHSERPAREDGVGRLRENVDALTYVGLHSTDFDVRTLVRIKLQMIETAQRAPSTGYDDKGTTGYERFLEPCLRNSPETDSEFTRGLAALLERR